MDSLESREKQIKLVLKITLVLNLVSAIMKIFVGQKFHFLSLSSSGVESLFDGSSNVLALFSIHFASQPPDEDHPYGHQKFETLGSLVLAGLLLVSAIGMGGLALDHYQGKITSHEFSIIPILTIIASMGISLFVSRYESKQGRELNSSILLADSDHTFGDFIISFGVLISIICGYFGIVVVDLVASIFVGFYLIVLSFKIFKQNIPHLMDSSPVIPMDLVKKVEEIPHVKDIHNFRSRGNSNWLHVDFHMHLTADLSFIEAHKVGKIAELKMKELLQDYAHNLDITVHIEPDDEEHKNINPSNE